MHVPPLHRPGRGRWGVRASCTHLDERFEVQSSPDPRTGVLCHPLRYVYVYHHCRGWVCQPGTVGASDAAQFVCDICLAPRGERGRTRVSPQSESPRTTGVCLACHVCINTSMASARCWSRRPPVATLVIVLFLATGGSAVDYGMKVQQAVGSVRAVSTSILRPHSLTRPQPRSPTASLALV